MVGLHRIVAAQNCPIFYFLNSFKQWLAIKDMLPGKATDCGVTATDNRLFVNAIVWLMRSGAP